MTKPNIILISVLIAMPIMGMTMISPSLPLIKGDLNSSFSDTQIVLSIYFLFLAIVCNAFINWSEKSWGKPYSNSNRNK